MDSDTTATTAKSRKSRPPVTLDSQHCVKPYGDFSGMASDYRSLSKANRYCMAYENYNGTISRYQPADTLSRITDEQLSDSLMHTRTRDLQDIPQPSSSTRTSTSTATYRDTPLSESQEELPSTSTTSVQIHSREEFAKRERHDIIREYKRTRAIFLDDYWPKKEASVLSNFDQARKSQLREDFRNNINEPVAVRHAINQKNRKDTEIQRSELLEHLKEQSEAEWVPEKEQLGEMLRTHYRDFNDLYEMDEDTAMATWMVEAGLG